MRTNCSARSGAKRVAIPANLRSVIISGSVGRTLRLPGFWRRKAQRPDVCGALARLDRYLEVDRIRERLREAITSSTSVNRSPYRDFISRATEVFKSPTR
jgi:hypothetical protein